MERKQLQKAFAFISFGSTCGPSEYDYTYAKQTYFPHILGSFVTTHL